MAVYISLKNIKSDESMEAWVKQFEDFYTRRNFTVTLFVLIWNAEEKFYDIKKTSLSEALASFLQATFD